MSDQKYEVCPGRSVSHDGDVYPAGCEFPADAATERLVAKGHIRAIEAPAPRPKPKRRTRKKKAE